MSTNEAEAIARKLLSAYETDQMVPVLSSRNSAQPSCGDFLSSHWLWGKSSAPEPSPPDIQPTEAMSGQPRSKDSRFRLDFDALA
jgi:hypothetical protein